MKAATKNKTQKNTKWNLRSLIIRAHFKRSEMNEMNPEMEKGRRNRRNAKKMRSRMRASRPGRSQTNGCLLLRVSSDCLPTRCSSLCLCVCLCRCLCLFLSVLILRIAAARLVKMQKCSNWALIYDNLICESLFLPLNYLVLTFNTLKFVQFGMGYTWPFGLVRFWGFLLYMCFVSLGCSGLGL